MAKKEKKEFLNINNTLYQTRLSDKFRNRKKYQPADPSEIRSFIPGTIVDIFAKEGQSVKQGDLLLILDAMKMKNRLKCPADARIISVEVKKGDRVPKGALLLRLEISSE
jgi:biotin carboxyl carrier protein